MTKKSNSIVSSIVIVVLVFLCIGFFSVFTNGFTTGLKTFYLTYNGERIINNRKDFEIFIGDSYKFDVKYTLGGNAGYEVKVLPTDDRNLDFDFIVNGQIEHFSEVQDLTKGFLIEKNEDSFILSATKDIDEILRTVYGTDNMTEVESVVDTGKIYFTLQVMSVDGKSSVEIDFHLRYLRLEIAPGKVVF